MQQATDPNTTTRHESLLTMACNNTLQAQIQSDLAFAKWKSDPTPENETAFFEAKKEWSDAMKNEEQVKSLKKFMRNTTH